MCIYKHYFNVCIDDNYNIVEMDVDLREMTLEGKSFIGKNFLDTFIEMSDQKAIKVMLNMLFVSNKIKENEISCDIKNFCNQNHLYIDFINEAKIIGKEKYILLNGIPHYENIK